METLGQVGRLLMTAEAIVVAVSAALGALAMFFVLSYILEVVACWRIFEKAGTRGWKSLIPVYSNYIRYKIAWRPLWFWVSALLFIGSLALDVLLAQGALRDGLSLAFGVMGAVIHLAGNFRLGRAFGRGVLFSAALAVFPPLFTLILGLGGAEYQGHDRPAPAKEGV